MTSIRSSPGQHLLHNTMRNNAGHLDALRAAIETYFADPNGHAMEILTVPYGGA